METVSIGTTQNITINYPLAGLMDRILAFILDSLLIFAAFVLSAFISTQVAGSNSMILMIILSIVAFLYFPVCEIVMDGQTIGKRSQKIKVVKLDGSKPGIGAYLLRWIMMPIDISMGGGIAIMMIIFTKKGQRLGDLLAGTTVVHINKRDYTLMKGRSLLESIDENYEPVFPQARQLTDDEIKLIREAVQAFRSNGQRQPINLLKLKMEEKLQLKSELPAIQFLHTLSKDYAYYATKKL